MLPSEDLEALMTLLTGLFSDPEGLRRFMGVVPGAEKLVRELPSERVSAAVLAHDVARSLAAHGLFEPFFERLCSERPHRIELIRPVALRFGITTTTALFDADGRGSAPRELVASPVAGVSQMPAAPELLQRFVTGPAGRRRLVSALQEQVVVGHDFEVAARLAEEARLEHFSEGATLLEQHRADTDLLLILAGTVTIMVHGREVAVRHAGQHVGEMAMIDPGQPRSATVVARSETVIARIPEDTFTRIAELSPRLWRRLAVELGVRLRERGGLVRPRSARPRVFIGSSDAGLPLARALATALADPRLEARVWPDGASGIGKTSLESLMAQLEQIDVGVLVVAHEDLRGSPAGRSELLLLLGVLMGALGRQRTLVGWVRGPYDEWLGAVQRSGALSLEIAAEADGPSWLVSAVAAEIRAIVEHHLSR